MARASEMHEKTWIGHLAEWVAEAGLALMVARKANFEALMAKRRIDLETMATKLAFNERYEKDMFVLANEAMKAGLFGGSNETARKAARDAWENENLEHLALKKAKADMEEAVRQALELAYEDVKETEIGLQYAQDWWNVVRAQVDLAVADVGSKQIDRFADSLRGLKYL